MIGKLFFAGNIECPDYLIKIINLSECNIDFEVRDNIAKISYCVNQEDKWQEGKYEIHKNINLKAVIKWDGCSHFNFMDEDIEDNGYFHFCGINHINSHTNLLNSLYYLAKKYMKDFSDDIADYKEMLSVPEVHEITEDKIFFNEEE